MKGVIANCLEELVKENYGKGKWEDSLEKAGLPRDTRIMVTQVIDDASFLNLVAAVCHVLGITAVQAADAFGDYWVNSFAPKIYSPFYRNATTAKEFLLKMDGVHKSVTKHITNDRPPRFDYEWVNDRTLVMHYKSDRGLIDFLVGLIKGVGRYYKETLKVRKLGHSSVEIVFS
jgi:hypothetical protein